ncbi:MAG TPA: hypothetical protein VKZ84_07125 [Bacteriovoracaceae bacterium]|nr:hypothetical protein [Bacteriovoracaceae bacterium]
MLSVSFYFIWLLGLFYWLKPRSKEKKLPPGEELFRWLKKFNWERREDHSTKLPEYKFFSSLVNLLLEMSRRFGGQYKEALLSVKESLNQDLQFEKKLREFIWGSYFQKFCIFSMSWGFILFAKSLTEVHLSFSIYLVILCWQILGLILFPIFCRILKRYYFSGIGQLWLSLYVLKALASVSLSRSEIFKMAQIYELNAIKHKNLENIVHKLQSSCELSLKQGGSYLKDIEELISECKFIEKWHVELFEKRMNALKLLILSIFFLPSYLAFIYFLLHSFLNRI